MLEEKGMQPSTTLAIIETIIKGLVSGNKQFTRLNWAFVVAHAEKYFHDIIDVDLPRDGRKAG